LVRAGLIALPLAFGGCAVVPPFVGAVAYGIDGISLLVSGKTTTDHAVSAMADQDCRLWRLLTLEDVCRPNEDEAVTAIAMAEPAAGEATARPPGDPTILPREAADLAPRTAPTLRSAAAVPVAALASAPLIGRPQAKPGAGLWPPAAFEPARPVPTPVPTAPARLAPPAIVAPASAVHAATFSAVPELYLVLGTFRQRGNAEALASRLLDAGAIITDPELGVSQFHRVVLGPVAPTGTAALRQQMQRHGVNGIWQATLCLDANATERSCEQTQTQVIPAPAPVRAARTMPAAVTGSLAAATTLPLSIDPIY
jgi:hypothetical protein